ncbi:right-handed parallel beta-helix repeat-containing protein [Streptomyces tubercidicus]|uniref:galactose-binding domain-containing protein n=1 Tax=Streptomyces tubercidicus TaxID=47759 RepID=UPI002E0E56A1|nr:right-handed parallel beta-helix repeat-containing protein [Streptomyces tubercidicus]
MTRRNVPRARRAIARLSAALIGLTACWGLPPTTATAAEQATYYASPEAKGTGDCSTPENACSLADAKTKVRSLTAAMTGDLVVELAGGTYELGSTLTFDSADSGKQGHDVIYRAKAGENVVLSGGTAITTWSEIDATKHIYKAAMPDGLTNTRQLWVDGQRADLARADASSVFGTMKEDAEKKGFTFTGTGPNSWTHPEAASVVYSAAGNPWRHSVCPVSSISAGTVTVKKPCLDNASNGSHWGAVGMPTAVENNQALMSSPGQFAVDPVAKEIYYIPRSGQDMSTAKAVAGRLDTLVNLAGTPASPVQHIQFTGLGFKYATWLLDDYGVVDVQANVRFTKYAADRNSSATLGPDNVGLLPANVTCHSCENVSFNGNTFEHLGGSGLGFDGGGKNNSVIGNVITDVSGNGVQIGAGDVYKQSATIESSYLVNNNYVHNVANEYLGGVGILATWVKGTHIEHNDVFNVPYTGISLGWGWGIEPASSTMVDNHVDNNHIHNVQTSALRDGGAIYVLGTQGSSPLSTMNGNYVEQDSQDFASLYLDNGSSYWDVKNNVVGGYTPHWAFVQNGAPIAHHNDVQNNYIGSDAGSSHNSTVPDDKSDPNSTNKAGLTTWPAEAQNIISNAGLEPTFAGLLNGLAQTNLAYKTTTFVSSSYSTDYLGPNANDERAGTLWASTHSDLNAYWETDLGASHTLSSAQILFRQDYDSPTERQGFEVWVSNDQDMSRSHTVACTVGGTPLPYRSTYNCPLPEGSWRYVAVVKKDSKPLALGEVRVYGH